MTIRTSAIFYRRGIPNRYSNFGFVSQANNTVVVPISKYFKSYYNTTNRTGYKGSFQWNNK